ncbi:WcaI family glycosyltransferase [Candidatus Cetobacterium colombiensis]|uniref:WcaI family glycosyltransferase n=1 Tax=Candidatus Cetobacterium colombiensis TaxID=3073100 RepID=A0ABU4W8T9_9FUSO|nr:WcaI family glycosyltransferase [Candidatus Cetobacterium colombiensis]MDX8335939.1 WcaI family glycosyltransferase [Candidatus Cetobacterium colombiensis]
MKKKIAVIGLNYYPEESSTGLYTTEMCEYLKKEFDITVITGYPYYPEWKISTEYQDKNDVLEEERNGVKIYRVKQYVPSKVNPLNRLYHYYDFYKKALNVAKQNNYDMVQVILPNIFLLNLAIKMKKLNKTKIIWAHVQDFEIDAGLETLKGIGKIGILKNILYSIEKKLFKKFDIVSSISDGMVKKLQSKGVKKETSYFFPNWSDVTKLYPIESSSYREELKLDEKDFVVMYSGNIGGKQDWETMIKSIEDLKNIKFIIAGDGNKKEEVFEKLKNKKNVILLPLQPKDRLNDFLNLADIHIIPQKKDAKDSFMPSKLLGIMAVEKPVLVLANKESNLYQVIKKEDIGYVLSENEYENLSETISNIAEDKSRIVKGKKSREYLLKNYIYEDIMEKLIEKILTKLGEENVV